jgi:exportin-1
MISAQPNKPIQEKLIFQLMELPNNAWDSLMAQAGANVDILGNTDNLKVIGNVLKTNVAACASIGSFYLPQLGRVYLDMLGLYKAVSGIISETVLREGPIATKTPKVRNLRTIKKEILKLMETYVKRVERAEDLDAVNDNLIPPLLDAILGDYASNSPWARDAEVLNAMTTITERLEVRIVACPGRVFLTYHVTSDATYSTSCPDFGCRVRTHPKYDKQRLFGIPRASCWIL